MNSHLSEEQNTLLEDCENREERLDDWERGFIDSISRQGFALTSTQDRKLNEIWDRVTAKG